MATTAIWDVTDRLKRIIDYAANPEKTAIDRAEQQGLQQVLAYARDGEKTEKQLYVSGINCDPLTAYEQMQRTEDGRHCGVSCVPSVRAGRSDAGNGACHRHEARAGIM
ncbi:hypothetical protein MXD62_10710, partial [Frankia sp. Mgl5]|nr:hypothetical protein [Frankia sp. Mgl5]